MTRVIGLSSKSAVTIFSSITVPHKSCVALNEADLENYISKAVWKSFDKLRHDAAERLDIGEIDLILANARVVGVKIDDHEVLNPNGFIGKTLEISLCITMVKRSAFPTKNSEKEGQIEVFEKGSVTAFLLSKAEKIDNLLYLEIGDKTTTIFLVSPFATSYFSEFEWGKSDIARAYTEEFRVPEDAAWEVYMKYAKCDGSLNFLRAAKKTFVSEFKTFVDGMTLCIKDLPKFGFKKIPPVYIKSSFDLPEEVYSKSHMFGKNKIKLRKLERVIAISDLVSNSPYNVYEWLNQLAKRRIKWLMP